jgi:hypothetical protein
MNPTIRDRLIKAIEEIQSEFPQFKIDIDEDVGMCSACRYENDPKHHCCCDTHGMYFEQDEGIILIKIKDKK